MSSNHKFNKLFLLVLPLFFLFGACLLLYAPIANHTLLILLAMTFLKNVGNDRFSMRVQGTASVKGWTIYESTILLATEALERQSSKVKVELGLRSA